MLNCLLCLSRSKLYWLLLLITCISLEAVALFYQYGLDYGPCVLCIHIRIWIAALLLVAIAGLSLGNCPRVNKACHLLSVVAAIGLLERSWQTLGIEQGWIEGSCGFGSGLPEWFALDKWFPLVFEVWESCGYTPELLFGITMAEGLMVFSVLLTAITLTLSFLNFRNH